ncbi:cupredoxin domain-containing protein [Pseudomonas lini]|uniref:cupredoxin domain-containing protein n=1 Tax=Pseudomonas lini TaxID=163011 RepID=UPI00345EA1B3
MFVIVQATIVLLLLWGGSVFASQLPLSDSAPVTLAIENHQFTPSTFSVPAGQRFRLQLTSHDDSVDEFESYDMKFEKIVVPGDTITVFFGPLHPGTYSFFDDYHPDQARGTVVVEPQKGQGNVR